jgi:MoaA/NifB/PqqE/SkfB family radical SAM enzyme
VAAFLEGFHRTVTERRVPLSGGIELTRRCSLRCRHCYLGAERTQPGEAAVLATGRALGLLAEGETQCALR